MPVTMKGSMVTVATIALGSMWRNMIRQFETPSARAARTYSRLRARRNSAPHHADEGDPAEKDREEDQQPETSPQDREEDDDDVELTGWRPRSR